MEAANQFQIFHHSIVNAMQLTNFSFLNSRMDYIDSQKLQVCGAENFKWLEMMEPVKIQVHFHRV